MPENTNIQLMPLGDSAVVVELDQAINLNTHRKIKALSMHLDEHPFPGMVEYTPAFTTVTVFYDPLQVSYKAVCSTLEQIVSGLNVAEDYQARTVEIPVWYGGEFGPDLEFVARHNGLSPEEVVHIHSNGEYLVYMIGFAPGFPYLGGMSERIAAPRRQSPRLSIPAGTVGIAGAQTGVYPIGTPGGWQLIGRTPLALFRPNENPPSLLEAGDIVRFRPICRDEYEALKEAAV